jgi:hypothetical protein
VIKLDPIYEAKEKKFFAQSYIDSNPDFKDLINELEFKIHETV